MESKNIDLQQALPLYLVLNMGKYLLNNQCSGAVQCIPPLHVILF
jgi:hypothetical protein